MMKVKRLGCLLRWAADELGVVVKTRCRGRLEADHMGERPGAFRKGSDLDVAPLCHGHHGERTDLRETFEGFTPERMRAFREQAVAIVHREMEKLHG